jgi:hypothetical protein
MRQIMKTLLFFTACLLLVTGVYAQETNPKPSQYLFKGVLVDADSGVQVGFAHVRNLYKGTITVTNQEGAFTIPVQAGDTLLISSIGFITQKYAVPGREPQGITTIFLQPKTEELKEVVITKFPSESRLKEQILQLELPEEGIALQLPPPLPTESSAADGGVTLFSHRGAITSFANKFNKKERGRQFKARIAMKEQQEAILASKFNKDLAQQITGIKNDEELNEFMKFCVLPEDFLLKANQYQIHKAVLGCFKEFVASR